MLEEGAHRNIKKKGTLTYINKKGKVKETQVKQSGQRSQSHKEGKEKKCKAGTEEVRASKKNRK